jgi:hypothetical protein
MSEDEAIAGPYFVWVKSVRGPQPQKWAELYFGLYNWKKQTVIAYTKISEEEGHMTLTELALRYALPTTSSSEN